MLIHRAIELDDVPVREIMTPRQKIFSLPSNMPMEEASAQVIEHMNSRVPVYDETRGPEHIVGVVYSKDLARLMFFRPKAQPRPADRATCRSHTLRAQPTHSSASLYRTPPAPGHARCARGP